MLYVLVGVLGTGVDFGSFYLALQADTPVIVAQWVSAFLGFTHNHVWQHYGVFDHNQQFPKTYGFSLFIAIISISISGPALLLLHAFILNIWICKVLVAGTTFVVLFWIRKRWVFTHSDHI